VSIIVVGVHHRRRCLSSSFGSSTTVLNLRRRCHRHCRHCPSSS
jgi:hypothetical protein